MSYCTPCPPCDAEFPLLCEPLETTNNGKRLVVEDSAACQKTIQTPVSQQVFKTDGAGNLNWTNGANSTVLGKDSTGIVEFATLNSVLQSGPVNLGSQPLTTGAITASSLTSTGVANVASLTTNGDIKISSTVPNGEGKSLQITNNVESGLNTNVAIYLSPNIASGNVRSAAIKAFQYPSAGNNTDLRFYTANFDLPMERMRITAAGNFGIGTTAPAKTLHVNGTVRLQGLPTYASNAAAITGGLVAGDLFIANVSGEGQLRIVV